MLKVENVAKAFGKHQVLTDLSFQVNSGEIYGLIGRNGAGKTTLMNIMAGLSKADAGKCTAQECKVGYLPDLPSFYEYLTTGEYLDFLLKNQNPEKRNELLSLVELADNLRIKPLSRGMRQRLGIAAAIINDPDIILLDEPTSALDPSGRADVMRILLNLKKQGKTIVLSTHILADMERICDKVGFLLDGLIKRELYVSELNAGCSFVRVVFEEAVAGLMDHFKKANLNFTVLNNQVFRFQLDGADSLETQKVLFQALATCKAKVLSIQNEASNLDSIFQEVCG